MSALNTFIKQTAWGHIDVLVIDMPPGTGGVVFMTMPHRIGKKRCLTHAVGDAQITIGQQIKLSGAVIVSTPQVLPQGQQLELLL